MVESPNPLIAAAQWNIALGDADRNRMFLERFAREAAAAGTKLLAIPELWTVSFAVKDEAALEEAARAEEFAAGLSKELDLILCGSSLEKKDGKLFNRATLWENGKALTTYRKAHLFSPTGETVAFSRGEEAPAPVDTSLGRIGILICYDLRFPGTIQHLLGGNPDLIVVCAQWGAARDSHWELLLKARAVEAQAFVVGSNRTGSEVQGGREHSFAGHSMIVDPWGEVLAEGDGEAGWISAEYSRARLEEARNLIPVRRDRREFS